MLSEVVERLTSGNALTEHVCYVTVSDKQAMAGATNGGEVGADDAALQTSPG